MHYASRFAGSSHERVGLWWPIHGKTAERNEVAEWTGLEPVVTPIFYRGSSHFQEKVAQKWQLVRVIDGDTVVLNVDLGFDISHGQRRPELAFTLPFRSSK